MKVARHVDVDDYADGGDDDNGPDSKDDDVADCDNDADDDDGVEYNADKCIDYSGRGLVVDADVDVYGNVDG